MKLTDQKCIYEMMAAVISRIDVVTMSLNEYSKDFTRFEIRHFLVAQNQPTENAELSPCLFLVSIENLIGG